MLGAELLYISCHRKKFDLKAEFVSYTEDPNTYLFKNLCSPRIFLNLRDDTFFKDCFPALNNINVNNTKTSTEPLVLSNSLPTQEENSRI